MISDGQTNFLIPYMTPQFYMQINTKIGRKGQKTWILPGRQ